MVPRDADDVLPEQPGVGPGRLHQRVQQLQPVAGGPARLVRGNEGQQVADGLVHSGSPQTDFSAETNSGECMSGCP